MAYIVLDLEFNQAFDFEKGETGNAVEKCRFEIIQIGAVKVNENFEIEDRFNTYVKPFIYKRIHPYVSKITGITKNDVENAPFFTEAYKALCEFAGDSKVFCVWGKGDINALYENVEFYKLLRRPAFFRYIDIQHIAVEILNYAKGTSVGLKTAVELFNIGMNDEEPFHNALYDALYTARIMMKIPKERLKIKIFNSERIITKNNRIYKL